MKIEVRVPDIGEFDRVEVVEVMVAAGDRVAVDDSLITLESDKASPEGSNLCMVEVQRIRFVDRSKSDRFYPATSILLRGEFLNLECQYTVVHILRILPQQYVIPLTIRPRTVTLSATPPSIGVGRVCHRSPVGFAT